MNWLIKIGNFWDRYVGRVEKIAGGIIAIGIIVSIVYKILAPHEIDCLRTDLTLRELETCVFEYAIKADQRTLQDLWEGKRITGIGKPGVVLPNRRSRLRDDPDFPRTIWITISP